jgi:hypothetical protein
MTVYKVVSSDQSNKYFCEWLAKKTDNEFVLDPTTTRTLGHVEIEEGQTSFTDEHILAVTALHNYTPFTCEVTLASSGAKKAKASQEYIHLCLNYVFHVAKKLTLVAHIAIDNYKSQCIADLLQLKRVGRVSNHYGQGKDAFLYELTNENYAKGPWAARTKEESINRKDPEKESSK